MLLRILWTSFFTILMVTPLQADWKKATIGEKFAGKRVVDSENEENGEEPIEGNSILYAKARIMVEIDEKEFLQSEGTEFKALGRIKGIAPNADYEGYWYVDMTAWHEHRRVPQTGYNTWDGNVTKQYEKKWKWKDKPKHLTPPADHLSRCEAIAFIDGGDNYHYWNDGYYDLTPPYTPDVAYAHAHDFSHEDADGWDCYRCTTADDELDTPCAKCGGEDRPGGIRVELPPPPDDTDENNGGTDDTDSNGDTDEDGDGTDGGGEESGSLDGGTTPTYIADTATRTFVSTNGKYYTTVDTIHEAKVTSSVPYESIVWQVEDPDHTGNIIPVVETDPGDGTLTEATLRYSIPADATTGTYKIMAYVWYSDLSARQLSYDLVVTPPEGLRPINGTSYYANSGDIIEMGVVADAPYTSVKWSISPGGDTSTEGPVVETDTATDTTTVAELRFALPTGAPGFRRITAHIFREDGTDYKLTYDMYVY